MSKQFFSKKLLMTCVSRGLNSKMLLAFLKILKDFEKSFSILFLILLVQYLRNEKNVVLSCISNICLKRQHWLHHLKRCRSDNGDIICYYNCTIQELTEEKQVLDFSLYGRWKCRGVKKWF